MATSKAKLMDRLLISLLIILFWGPTLVHANVCSEGVGNPPFLDISIDANVLLLVDNSASMLDLAYNDAEIKAQLVPAEDPSQCFDESFLQEVDATTGTLVQNLALEYAGNFDPDLWYSWDFAGDGKPPHTPPVYTEDSNTGVITYSHNDYGPYLPWRSGVSYSIGDRVFTDGIIYTTTTGCISSGDYLVNDDLTCSWEKLFTYNQSAYDDGVTYTQGNIVSFKGSLYELTSTPYTGSPEEHTSAWQLLYIGEFFALTTDSITTSSYCNLPDGVTATVAYNENLCIAINEDVFPRRVEKFVATGNFLNWATASKFDVQKQILTGGKYDEINQRLISESRGCSASGFTKQVGVSERSNDGTTADNFLVMRTRGGLSEDDGPPLLADKLDEDDDITRIDILGIFDAGFNYAACEDAVDKILNHGLNGSQNLVDACLKPINPDDDSKFYAEQRAALNHALQYCWQANPNLGNFYKSEGGGAGACDTLYEDYDINPNSITPYQNAYHCYGVYNPLDSHGDRRGYVGRCYDPGGGSGGDDPDPQCLPRMANLTPALSCTQNGDLCTYTTDDGLYLIEDNQVYKCENVENDGTCKTNPQDIAGSRKYWYLLHSWFDISAGTAGEYVLGTVTGQNVEGEDIYDLCSDASVDGCSEECEIGTSWDPDAAIIETGWSGDLNGDFGFEGVASELDSPLPIDPSTGLPVDLSKYKKPLDNEAEYLCIWQAMEDYCGDLTTSEVVDPSDASGNTSEYGNLPANLIDSGVLGQLGVTHPLVVFKGFIRQIQQPIGIIQEKAQEVRLGLMAFNDAGAKTECDDYPNEEITRYCPDGNRDGAVLLAEMSAGRKITQVSPQRRHVDDVSEMINDLPATSWTPLAEAMFGALRYYTQNPDFCLNEDDDGNCLDFSLTGLTDPIQYSCQPNNIIIITEGESTADVSTKLEAFINDPQSFFGDGLLSDPPETMADYPGDGDNDALSNTCAGLLGSTFFDDLTWWGQHAQPLYAQRQLQFEDKFPITTRIVTTGVLDSTGTDECNPDTLMTQAAINGGIPAGYYEGENPDQVRDQLLKIFGELSTRSSTGSAASVISNSRSGEGAVYQAVFWPEVERENEESLRWVGDVHSFYVDSQGRMWDDWSGGNPDGVFYTEDTNGDGRWDASEDQTGGTTGCLDGDRRVFFYYDDGNYIDADGNPQTREPSSRICLNDSVITTGQCVELSSGESGYCGTGDDPSTTADDNDLLIREFKYYVWSANDRLAAIPSSQINENRVVNASLADSYPYGTWDWHSPIFPKRYIFTWNDLDNDGIVDESSDDPTVNEIIPFTPGTNWTTLNTAQTGSDPRGTIFNDFMVTGADPTEMETNLDNLVNWLRGYDDLVGSDDDYVYRCRKYPNCYTDAGLPTREIDGNSDPVWRLGDIVFSTPKLVAKPAEAFHFVYADPTYSYFIKRYENRRHVIYVGANDGMLHAFNGGFFDPDTYSFFRNYDPATGLFNNSTAGTNPGPPLGTELWAYVPYNLQPHLRCLADPAFCAEDSGTGHKYYVDKEPRIFDMQIFEEEDTCREFDDNGDPTGYGVYHPECIHPRGWGTILVGAMRFGGSPITAAADEDSNWPNDDNRKFISAYFVMDITDPERPPRLLGEMTMTTDPYSDSEMTYTQYLEYIGLAPSFDVLLDDNGEISQDTDNADNPIFFTTDSSGATLVDDNGNPAPIPIPIRPKYIDLGFTTPMVTGVVMKEGDETAPPTATPTGTDGSSHWYLIMGNGPTTLDGENAGLGKIAVLPMAWLTGTAWTKDSYHPDGPEVLLEESDRTDPDADTRRPFRIPNRPPTGTDWANGKNEGGILVLPAKTGPDPDNPGVPEYADDGTLTSETISISESYVSDLISIDLNLITPVNVQYGGLYETEAIYFGTSDGPKFVNPDATFWPYGGRAYRLVTRDFVNNDPRINPPSNWTFKKIMDTEGPITGALSLGWDDINFWVYFGTGKFLSTMDKPDKTPQYFFGVKETLTADCDPSWEDYTFPGSPGSGGGGDPGNRGFVRSDYILTGDIEGIAQSDELLLDPYIFCADDAGGNCPLGSLGLPTVDTTGTDLEGSSRTFYKFDDYRDYIAGDGRDNNYQSPETGPCAFDSGIDGWYRVLREPGGGERVIGQSTLLGGLCTYTTYQPEDNQCEAEGNSFLYGVHYQTGTAWYEEVFPESYSYGGAVGEGGILVSRDRLELGKGLSTTPSLHTGTGVGPDAKAFIQTSTGAILEINQENLPIKPLPTGRVFWSDDQNPKIEDDLNVTTP